MHDFMHDFHSPNPSFVLSHLVATLTGQKQAAGILGSADRTARVVAELPQMWRALR